VIESLDEPARFGEIFDRHAEAVSYNKKLWMLDLLKGATYPPS
jgi:hypothetical protein